MMKTFFDKDIDINPSSHIVSYTNTKATPTFSSMHMSYLSNGIKLSQAQCWNFNNFSFFGS